MRCQNFSFEKVQKCDKNHLICVKHEEKNVKEFKMYKLLVYACKSQDFAQSQKKIAQSHNHETLTFRNSVVKCHLQPVTNANNHSQRHSPNLPYSEGVNSHAGAISLLKVV